MELNYELTKEDYVDFNMYHVKNSKETKKAVFIQRYVISLMFLIIPIVIWILKKETFNIIYVICPLFWIMWILFYNKAFDRSITKKINRMLDKSINSGLIGMHNITIDNGELIEKTSNGYIKNNIRDINEIQETKDHIFIYISNNNAYVIPKRTFKSKEKLNNFKTELKIK